MIQSKRLEVSRKWGDDIDNQNPGLYIGDPCYNTTSCTGVVGYCWDGTTFKKCSDHLAPRRGKVARLKKATHCNRVNV